MAENTRIPADAPDEARVGLILGIMAYSLWGVLPIYFRALEPADPLEILSQRILWSAGFCLLFWIGRRDLHWMLKLVRNRRLLLGITFSAYVLGFNWGVYIYAVAIGNVLESSLGYFINPLMMVVVGVIVLHERLTAMQWTAIGVATVAVIVITVDYGHLPWIALILASTFTVYGFIKKMQGSMIGALQTMTVESIVLIPVAIAILIWIDQHAGRLTFTTEGWKHTLLLIFLGLATIAPLVWFTAAATRLPLSVMGLIQFLTPIGQFIVGAFLFHETMSTARWIGFGLVWVALVILTIDSFRRAANRKRISAHARGTA